VATIPLRFRARPPDFRVDHLRCHGIGRARPSVDDVRLHRSTCGRTRPGTSGTSTATSSRSSPRATPGRPSTGCTGSPRNNAASSSPLGRRKRTHSRSRTSGFRGKFHSVGKLEPGRSFPGFADAVSAAPTSPSRRNSDPGIDVAGCRTAEPVSVYRPICPRAAEQVKPGCGRTPRSSCAAPGPRPGTSSARAPAGCRGTSRRCHRTPPTPRARETGNTSRSGRRRRRCRRRPGCGRARNRLRRGCGRRGGHVLAPGHRRQVTGSPRSPRVGIPMRHLSGSVSSTARSGQCASSFGIATCASSRASAAPMQ
jgi:hypothetical protein